MKSCLMLLTLLIPSLVAADDDSDSRSLVTTSGKAEIRIVPDLADLWFDVEVRHADLAQARKQQAERAEKVVKALKAAGVQDADLQTSQVSISPNYIENRQETANVQFYSVSQTVTCTVKDLKKVPDITAQVLESGATSSRTGACGEAASSGMICAMKAGLPCGNARSSQSTASSMRPACSRMDA